MDRAAKLKKYGKKRGRKKGRRTNRPADFHMFAWPGIGAAVIAAVFVCAVGLLLFSLFHKKEEEELFYVTKAELASCMSFLLEDVLPADWEKDADRYVTKGQMKELVQNIGLARILSVDGGSDCLHREAVMRYYEQILDYLDLEGAVQKETILVLSSDGKSCQTPDQLLKVALSTPNFQQYHTYGVYLIDQTIVGIKAESEKTIALRQAHAYAVKDGKVQIQYEKNDYEIPCSDTEGMRQLENDLPDVSCTLCIKGGAITKIKNIEKEASSDKKAKATQKLPEHVKVLLLNQGKIYYDQIYLSCDGDWIVKKNKKTAKYKKSDVLSIKKLKIKKGKYAIIQPSASDGRLFLTDKNGSPVSKGYYGSMTVYKDSKGYYIVNKVQVEKYLYSVVASEMPASFGMEALKAQAVCARSYVYKQIASDDYRQYHAQIDDSTNYQVYNKSEVVEADVQAVEATAGEVMYVGEDIATAYYFSSSFGRTSNMEIWMEDVNQYPYLKIKSLDPKEKEAQTLDLSDENAFKNYIHTKSDTAFDSGSQYFRWKAKVELSGCTKALKERIEQRQKINPNHFTFYSTNGKKAKKVSSMKGFGGAKKMYCKKRGRSGAILILTIQFEFGKVEIASEYNIRSIVGCGLEQITYANGTSNTTSGFLPSAYFSISYHKKSGRYVLTGGGNGHGMGMSQYGAAGMAKQGWDYKKILTFFYDGVTVRKGNESSA